jgi:nitrite reductase (cytochrome c-552)
MNSMTDTPTQPPKRRPLAYLVAILIVAGLTVGVVALMMNIWERKREAREHFVKLVEMDEDTVDPAVWGRNFPRQYDSYKRTVDTERTKHGGSEAIDKLLQDKRLVRLYAGYAFSKDFREERGHAFMLKDQDETKRVHIVNQPGSCLHCHASVMPAYRNAGNGDVMAGFQKICAQDWKDARKLVDHPVSCVDCHDPKTTQLRVSRPGFLNGIQELANHLADRRKEKETEKAQDGKNEGYKEVLPHLPSLERYAVANSDIPREKRAKYDVNAQATRQELRSFVCGQCHVEYYFKKTDNNLLVYPWAKGLKVEEIEAYYDAANFTDWPHKETGTGLLKAQHPEFEMWNQGIHARSGVSCADCHMPYKREGAVKISDHHIRSPLLNIARACQTCHRYSETEILARAEIIQDRTKALVNRAEDALIDLLDAIQNGNARKISPEKVAAARALHRKAQWRLDFVAAENSMGFHAPLEAARILAEAIDYARQGQIRALGQE